MNLEEKQSGDVSKYVWFYFDPVPAGKTPELFKQKNKLHAS